MLPQIYFRTAEEEHRYRSRVQADLDRSDVVLTPSECAKRDLLKAFRLRRDPVVVPNANLLPVPGPHSALLAPPLTRGIFYINFGGYEQRKGLDVLVPLYDRLYREGRVGGPLVLTGKPNHFNSVFQRDVEAAVQSGAVIEFGQCSDEELSRLVSQAKALIYPSLYEGFGLPVLEAMSVGCPVICTDNSSLPELCGEAAVYISPGDEEHLGRAILLVENDPDLRRRLADGGHRQASRFSWSYSADRFLIALDRILTQPSRLQLRP
jgi:glycosyltransferase involved in cell wall biosynthesis